ncbi:MAG: bifunctional 2',3'-cyclic-nucleotide 2'-phosphodiesterase/3'-nucleotidase, partial [Roseinatronobacter sp.]|nr:bifunctional 2',3'-cyclic-nucleotide 2'-phosphodiesterase/3'-nucleotidase [Roseinatronobacter sp.]
IDNSFEVSATVDLRILETTDLHVHLHPYDYYADCPNPDLGLSRLAELIDQARQQARNCLLFDNGDFLQGTPVGDFFAYDKAARKGELHPVMAAMNALQYDAMTLGNHEFSYGLDFLMRSLEQAEFPVVSANILHKIGGQPRKDHHLVKPYRLLRRQITDRAGRAHSICIGVIGCAPAQITLWERQHLNGRIQTRDMVDSVAAWVPEMREAGADLVVLLAHTGIGPIRHTENMENAVIPLCGIEGVDVVLSGHTHQVFPSPLFADIPGIDVARGTICGTPTVMSGFYGSHLGVIDLQMVRTGPQWEVLDVRVATHALRDAATQFAPITAQPRKVPLLSPKVRKIIERAHSSVLENIRQPIGKTETPINSFFVYLGQSAATALVAAAQRDFVARLIADTGLRDLTLLSAVSPSKAGGLGGANNFTHIKPGVLTLRSLADLYVFPNRVAASKLNGAQLALWLERSVSAYAQLVSDKPDQLLMNPDFPGYNFEIIYGLSYEVELSVPARFGADGLECDPAAGRIRNLMWNGQPLDMAAEFIVCTNSFRAQGAGGFAGTGPESVVLEHPATTRDILRDHVTAHAPVAVDPQAPFRLRSGLRAQAVLQTSIAAHAHLDMISHFTPEVLGADERGFLRLGVTI